jgi:pyruvate ferredoxin oxidoreductase gamma subunit
MAFVRISEKPIITREKIYTPDYVIVLDPTLLKLVNVEAGLKASGTVIVNTTKSFDQIRTETGLKARLALVDASKIAMETMRVPITNTTMLGALIKAAPGLVSMEALKGPINHRFGPIAERNVKSCARAFEETVVEG